jgi:SAM-dependent methyltransferase
MRSAKCVVCGGAVTKPWLTECPDYYLGTKFRVDYAECVECGLVQQTPMPAETAHFYSEYPIHQSKGKLFALVRRLLIRNVYLEPELDASEKLLFDLGCGDGSYLESVKDRYREVAGFEPVESHAKAVRDRLGCSVYAYSERALEKFAGRVDVVTAHFVLEHVSDPHLSFDFAANLLKPGGFFYLALPNIRSGEAKLFRRKWHGLDAPRHLSFPDENSVKLLAEKHGFAIERISFGVFPNTIAASIVNLVTGRHRNLPFLALLPLGFLVALVFPAGAQTFRLRRV